jgi:hypothetical protein
VEEQDRQPVRVPQLLDMQRMDLVHGEAADIVGLDRPVQEAVAVHRPILSGRPADRPADRPAHRPDWGFAIPGWQDAPAPL